MIDYKKWATAGVVLSIAGVLVGCGTHDGLSNSTAITKTSTTSSKTITTNISTLTVPQYPHWTGLTATDTSSTVITQYGMVSISPLGITHNDIFVSLHSSGVTSTLYTLSNSGFRQIDGWQIDRSYLALRFGLPPSAEPTTGDYGYEDVVVNLKTKQVLANLGSAIQSTDYLDSPYFVQTSMQVATDGTPESFIIVINLTTKQKITFQLPKNALGDAVESKGRLYYTVVSENKSSIVPLVLPKTGWQSMLDSHWKPIQLPSK